MAYYAFLDKNNIVTEVIAGIDETEFVEGLDTETWYGNYRGQVCKRTSYNGNIRANFAAIGSTYEPNLDVFIPIQPYLSWKLNYITFGWEAPVAMPNEIEGFRWIWSEINKEWVSLPFPTE